MAFCNFIIAVRVMIMKTTSNDELKIASAEYLPNPASSPKRTAIPKIRKQYYPEMLSHVRF